MASFNPPISDWQGKRVWVVGASSGIGKALAELLTQKGAVVIASARRQQALSQLVPAARFTVPVDLSDEASLEQATEQSFLLAGDVDVVFWVAGVYHPMAVKEISLAGVHETLQVNLASSYLALQLVLRRWLAQPRPMSRHWVFVSSVAGYRGLPLAAAYGASKAALTYLAETSYLELKAEQIGVSVVCPGFVKSRLTDRNDFHMPAMISAEQAAQDTLRGMAKGAFEIHYPKRFTWAMKLLRILPYRLYFYLTSKSLPK